jgi:hypothetical protein
MTVPKMIAIALIFMVAVVAWMVLGGSVMMRTNDTGSKLSGQVGGLWGEKQVQSAPTFTGGAGATALQLVGSDIAARFKLDDRRRGLLWYATYVVDLAATYKVFNPGSGTADAVMTFAFPSPDGVYDGFAVKVDGHEVRVVCEQGKAISQFTVPAGRTVSVATGYRTNGMDEWRYQPSPDGAGVIRDFTLAMTTDFAAVDYPTDAVSPTSAQRTGSGWDLTWRYDSVVSGRPIALSMPKPADAGPLVSRVSFFAPVSLLFFFAALVLLTATRGVKLHPMHYCSWRWPSSPSTCCSRTWPTAWTCCRRSSSPRWCRWRSWWAICGWRSGAAGRSWRSGSASSCSWCCSRTRSSSRG